MPIEVELPDGNVAEFPDGTPKETITAAIQKRLGASPRPSRSMAGSALEGAAQGLTFGFSDELEGAVRAGIGKLTGDQRSFGELYDEGVAVPRQRIKEARQDNPVSFGVGEIGSAVALPLGAARLGIRGAMAAASGRGLGARSLAGAKEGAVYGGLYGAGTAEGGISDRLTGAGTGAAIGSALGAAMPGAVDVAGAVGSRLAQPFRPATTVASEKLGEAIARDNPAGGLQQFAERVRDLRKINPSARVMDAGGDNVRGMMRAATNVPNAGRERARRIVDARQANQWSRIEDSLVESMGKGSSRNYGANYFDELDRIALQMDDEGAKLIQPALQIETPMTDRLRAVMARPTMQELWGNVKRKLADQGDEIGLSTRTQALHRMKMELDEAIGMSKRAEQMGNKPGAGWDTRTLTILKRDLLNAIDNPAYKAGLKQYASTAQLRNALEDGYEAFSRKQPEQMRAALKALESDTQRDFYRFGAMRAVLERIRKGNVNNDRTDALFSSPEMQTKLRAMFPSHRQFREFQRFLVSEAKMADSRKAMQGNSTTARQLTEGAEAGKTAGMVVDAMNAATGSGRSALNLLAQGYNRFTGVTPRVANELLDLGMSKSAAGIDQRLAESIAQAANMPAKRARLSRGLIGSGAAGLTGPLEVTVYPPGDPRNYR